MTDLCRTYFSPADFHRVTKVCRRTTTRNNRHYKVLCKVKRLPKKLNHRHPVTLLRLHQPKLGQLRARHVVVMKKDVVFQHLLKVQQYLQHVKPQLKALVYVARVAKLRPLWPLNPLVKHPKQRDKLVRRRPVLVKQLRNYWRVPADLAHDVAAPPRIRVPPLVQLRKLYRNAHHKARQLVVGRNRLRPVRHPKPLRQLPLPVVQPPLPPLHHHMARQHLLKQHLKQPHLLVRHERTVEPLKLVLKKRHVARPPQQPQLLLLPKPKPALKPKV